MSSNVPNNANTYLPPSPVEPWFLNITSINNSNPMVVTTNTTNTWSVGQLAYFVIPFSYGMQQLNTQTAQVTNVDNTGLIFTFNISSKQFDSFSVPSTGEMPATMAPAGSRNTYNFTTIPFHSEGNFGN